MGSRQSTVTIPRTILSDNMVETDWVDGERNLNAVVEINSHHTTMEIPQGLKHFCPHIHQLALVKAALDLEQRRTINVSATTTGEYNPFFNTEPKHVNSRVKVESSAIVISDPFGSGKTLMVTMIILSRQTPNAIPNIMQGLECEWNMGNWRQQRPNTYLPLIRERVNKLIYPNLIVTSPGVLIKWKNEIKLACPHFRVFIIGNVTDLANFYKIYKDGRINNYNVVLLKNGKVTGNFRLDEEEKNICDVEDNCEYGVNCSRNIGINRNLINVVTKITQGACWSRVFYDDFDTVQIPNNAIHINSIITYYVSATRKYNCYKKVINDGNDYVSLLKSQSQRTLNIVSADHHLFRYFNLRTNDVFRDKSLQLPIIKFYKYVLKNPEDKYIKLIGAMGEQDANDVMEMLNGDAISTAAEAVGIVSTTVADIFEKILSNKYQKYMTAVKAVTAIESAIKFMKDLPDISERVDAEGDPKPYRNTEIDAIVNKVAKGKGHTGIKYTSDVLVEHLSEKLADKIADRNDAGKAIERVKDNIKEGDCPICMIPLEENDAIINKCCGIVMCAECGIKGARMDTSNMYGRVYRERGGVEIQGNCPQCRAPIKLHELIFINQEMDLEKLIDARGDEVPEEPAPMESVDSADSDNVSAVEKITNPKLKILCQIANGENPEGGVKFDPNLTQLLQGKKSVEVPHGALRKVIVFAAYTETLKNIQTCLEEQNIQYMRLIGTYKQIHQIICDFKTNDAKVLLINSSTNCAGLDLQFATDLVFFHKIMDGNIQAQVAGRLQRIGRQYDGKMHWLLYRNEKDYV